MLSCPNEESLDAFLGGRLAAESRADLEAHLDVCAGCTRLVARLLSRATLDRGSALDAGAPAARPRRREGDKLGRYILLGEAGTGGMGAVYAAYDTALDRKVALKFLADGRSEGDLARLRGEAATMAQLNHPNVVTVYDAGIIEGEAFLAMELVAGETLATWRTGARSVREILTVMAAAARGLAAAHAAGIIHRDVKPQNILIGAGRVLVTDFGLSLDARSGGEADRRISGTPGYMAPEQWRGDPVDGRSDVFAFSATLYLMLYGALPFPGDSVTALREAALAGRAPTPRPGARVPARVQRLVLAGLAAEPARRPADLGAIADQLTRAAGASRRRWLGAGAAGLAVLAAFWGGGYAKAGPERACRASGAALDAIWNEGVRARLAAGAMPAMGTTIERLDGVARAWHATHEEACAATFGEHRQSENVLDLRMVCLGGQRAVLEAVVRDLGSASPARLAEVVSARLPDPSTCAIAGLTATKPLPHDPDARAGIAGVERSIAEAEAAKIAADYPRARASAESALARARAIGYDPTTAHALYQLATIVAVAGKLEDDPPDHATAERLFLETIALAERSGDDQHRASAAAELVATYAATDRFAQAASWGELAAAAIDRLGNPPSLRANLESNLGGLYNLREEMGPAKAAWQRALAARRLQPGATRADFVGPTVLLCYTEADATARGKCLDDAFALAQATVGPQHPAIAEIYLQRYDLLRRSPATHRESCQWMRKAVAIEEAQFSPGSHRVLGDLSNLAQCLIEEGELAEAKLTFDTIFARAVKPSKVRGHARNSYGIYLLSTGDLAGAIRSFRLAIEDRARVFGVADEKVIMVRGNLIEALTRHREAARALAEADETIGLCADRGATPPSLATIHLGRALALLELGRAHEAGSAARKAARLLALGKAGDEDQGAALIVIGKAERAEGHAGAALADFEAALARLPAGNVDPVLRADAALQVARTLSAGGAPSRRACSLGREAFETLSKASGEFADERAEARAFWTRARRSGC